MRHFKRLIVLPNQSPKIPPAPIGPTEKLKKEYELVNIGLVSIGATAQPDLWEGRKSS
jgi:hypothetical protein